MLRGLIALYQGAPQNPAGAGGRMALADHFRELRARLLRSATVIVLAMVVALVYYDALAEFLLTPYYRARFLLPDGVESEIVVNGLAASLIIQLKICALAAVIATSPYWLLQIWRFVLPGLYPKERKWTRVFVSIAGPLFLLGCTTGFLVLPKGIQVLISFAPDNVNNLVQVDDYVTFVTRMLLVFGVAFEIPLFVVMLYLVGVVTPQRLADYRPWTIIGVFVFAAVATPSTDPFSMLMLALPMTILMLIAEVIVRLMARRKARNPHPDSTENWADDQISPI